MNKKVLIGGIILIVIGVVVTATAFIPKNAERQANTDNWTRLSAGAGKETEGVIVDSVTQQVTEGSRRSRSINTVYCGVYEFKVADQVPTVQAVGDDCKDTSPEVVEGTTGTIIYDESNPAISFVKSDASDAFYKDTGGSQIVAIVLGLALVVAGAVALFAARPKTPEQLAAAAEKRRKSDEELAKLIAEVEGEKKQ